MAKSNRQSGMEFEVFENGAFYQGVTPGGFTDAKTGIIIPGPRAVVDDSANRNIISLTDIPDPIQLPHKKLIMEVTESGKERKEVEKDFNSVDETPLHDAFQHALATGIIQIVSPETMQERYPEAWAKRQAKIVFRTENVLRPVPFADMLEEAEQNNRLLSVSKNHANLAPMKKDIAERRSQIDAPAQEDGSDPDFKPENSPPTKLKPGKPPKPVKT